MTRWLKDQSSHQPSATVDSLDGDHEARRERAGQERGGVEADDVGGVKGVHVDGSCNMWTEVSRRYNNLVVVLRLVHLPCLAACVPRTRILLRGLAVVPTAARPLRASQRALNLHYDLLALYDLRAHVYFFRLSLCAPQGSTLRPTHMRPPGASNGSGLVGRMRPD